MPIQRYNDREYLNGITELGKPFHKEKSGGGGGGGGGGGEEYMNLSIGRTIR